MRLLIVLIMLFPAIVFASPYEAEDKFIGKCSKTPYIGGNENYPGRGKIVPSNKLALPAGKSAYANGQLVYIAGRILDENCVPISDAIVEIWHADPEGNYKKASLGGRMSPYPYFTGSGRAVTDNLGRFNFVTLFPGTYEERAPHIHVRVLHKDFKEFNTEMFFAGDRRNSDDKVFAKVAYDKQSLIAAKVWKRTDQDGGIAAKWDITIAGKNPYRKF